MENFGRACDFFYQHYRIAHDTTQWQQEHTEFEFQRVTLPSLWLTAAIMFDNLSIHRHLSGTYDLVSTPNSVVYKLNLS